MGKKRLYVDFDHVLGNTSHALCAVYNKQCKYRDGFKEADPDKLLRWDFSDECPLFTPTEKKDIWGYDSLFKNLPEMKDAGKYIELLAENFEIIIVTIGIGENIKRKIDWFNNNEQIKKSVANFIYLSNCNMAMNKDLVNMSNGIFIDDNTLNLISSNASHRYVFGKKTGWNNDSDNLGFRRLWNWEDAYLKLTI